MLKTQKKALMKALMRRPGKPDKLRSESGVAMIEVLLAMFVLLVGLLGLAGVQMTVANANMEAYQRAQALVLLQDIVERFSASRQLQACFNFSSASTGYPYVGQPASSGDSNLLNVSPSSSFPCSATGVPAVDGNARAELASWDRQLKGAAEKKSGNFVGAMLGARGCVYSATDASTGMLVYTFAVAWQGTNDTFAPTVRCGKNLYGAETKRRVVWTTARVAGLK